jgi:monolysocardiolipin acyltransferase
MIERLIQISAIGCSNFYMSILNSHKIHNHKILTEALANRPPGVALITYSNHTCVLDDPLVLALLTPSIFSTGKYLRYALGAEEVCLGGSSFHRWLFMKAGRAIPIRRGEGPFQPAMDQAIRLLNQGNWIHIFVEGKVYPDSSKLHTPIKHGIARLILECRPKPWILPIVHTGMEHIKPYGLYAPKFLKHVDIYIGNIIDGGEMVNRLPPYAEPVLYYALTRYLERKLQKTYPSPSDDLLEE